MSNTHGLESPSARAPTIRVGRITLFVDGYAAQVSGRHVSLTRSEYTLLLNLSQSPGRTLSMNQIARLGGDTSDPPTDRAIRARVAAIRKKLGQAGEQIKNLRGVGYKIVEQ